MQRCVLGVVFRGVASLAPKYFEILECVGVHRLVSGGLSFSVRT